MAIFSTKTYATVINSPPMATSKLTMMHEHQSAEALALSDKARWNDMMDKLVKQHWIQI